MRVTESGHHPAAGHEFKQDKTLPQWHGWHAFRRGLATNLHRLRVSDKVIQQILRHANVTTTMNIYVKTVSVDAANAMKSLETMCATTVQPERLGSTRIM